MSRLLRSVLPPSLLSTLEPSLPADTPFCLQVLAHTPMNRGGLTPLAVGLFHTNNEVKAATVDFFDTLQQFSVRTFPSASTSDLRLTKDFSLRNCRRRSESSSSRL